MPSFDIVKDIKAGSSFRIEQVKSGFDLQTDHIKEHFVGNIDIEDKNWNVGLIVGRSGTGKSTIAKEVFSEYYYEPHMFGDKAIIDEMPTGISYKDITHTFTSVGFSSPPSWLKPYHVLSNGEQMRVNLAYAILEGKECICFDEFTSVVDRTVAKVCSYAISKAVRRLNKKFIAVSCHDDILDWLEPDWVYDTNSQSYTFRGHIRSRPEIKLDIYQTEGDKKDPWKIFSKYHYLNENLNNGIKQFIGYMEGSPVCHTGILQMPARPGKKRIHRLVVLPDYQGIGIGSKFITEIAEHYKKSGDVIYLQTSSPALLNSMRKLKSWVHFRSGRVGVTKSLLKLVGRDVGNLLQCSSGSRVTYSFKYIGGA